MPTTYKASDVTQAARQCAALARRRPSWPQARVRATVAKELQLRPSQLRYLLRRAVTLGPSQSTLARIAVESSGAGEDQGADKL